MAAKGETPKIDEDWQFNKSLAQCNKYMFENGIGTDITFLVSDVNDDFEVQTFSAHKNMLISRSPVFFAMLCGDLAETGQIKVTDVHTEAFRQMLSYIYTDEPKLSLDCVVHVIYASKKYLLPGLTTKCAAFIKACLNPENVCSILNQILMFEENDLSESCLHLIMQETLEVLDSEGFLSISREVLLQILDIRACEVKEVDLFQACLKWARQKCVEEEKEATGTNIREILGECIYQFRFSDIEDFSREVCPTGVYNKDEVIGIFRHLIDRQAVPVPPGFYCEARLRPIYTVFSTAKPLYTKCENLHFKMTIHSRNETSIKINGLYMTSMSPDEVSNMSMEYNDEKVRGDTRGISNFKNKNILLFKCKCPFVIKPGSSNLEVTYRHGLYKSKGNVFGVAQHENTFKDGDRIELKLSSSNRFMPLLGLSYQLVL